MNEKRKLSVVARWAIVLILVLLLVAMLPFLVQRFGPESEKYEYWRVAKRISVHFVAIKELEVGPGRRVVEVQRPDRTRVEVAKAVNTALWNSVFFREADGTHRRLYALADRLERSKGAELATEEGCLRLVAELERDFPDAYDYSLFHDLRAQQDEGLIPRLPAGPTAGK